VCFLSLSEVSYKSSCDISSKWKAIFKGSKFKDYFVKHGGFRPGTAAWLRTKYFRMCTSATTLHIDYRRASGRDLERNELCYARGSWIYVINLAITNLIAMQTCRRSPTLLRERSHIARETAFAPLALPSPYPSRSH